MKVQSQIYIHSHSNDNGAITICTATLNTDSSLPPSSAILRSSSSSMAAVREGHLSPVEAAFKKLPDSLSARENLKFITSKPHVAGTPGDYEMAMFVKGKLESYGIPKVHVHEVPAGITYPIERSLEVRAKNGTLLHKAGLAEPILPSDHTSNTWWRNHTLGGYSPSGKATGSLVYANFGLREDFQVLRSKGINVTGMIVLVRYGKCHRGLKAKNAVEFGAAGLLIYSDPQQDGYTQGEAYPNGPWRPKLGVQRGSLQYMSLCEGDPGRHYLPGGSQEACGYDETDLIPTIPVLPISWGDAVPLLNRLEGPPAPSTFTGTLSLTNGYRLGPTAEGVQIHLRVLNNRTVTPIWNVIGIIPGKDYQDEEKDSTVLIGNHRDAWVYGAADPNSGTAQMLEVAAGLGYLYQNFTVRCNESLQNRSDNNNAKCLWRPKRTIYICSWDGEEHGLIGSVAWGELNRKLLNGNIVAYLNVDTGVTGPKFYSGGTPSLAPALMEVLKHVKDPNTGKDINSLWDKQLYKLGGGSDFTVFLQHYAIPCVDMWFGTPSGAKYGAYHSVYDSFDWMSTQGDPGFHYHKAMAQIWGLLLLRMADAEIVALNHKFQAWSIKDSVVELKSIAKEQYGLNLNSMTGMKELEKAVDSFQHAADYIQEQIDTSTFSSVDEINDKLMNTERKFLVNNGMKGRKWFRHLLLAPGLYTGYGSEIFPAVMGALREHLEQSNSTEVNGQLHETASRISLAAKFLHSANGESGQVGVAYWLLTLQVGLVSVVIGLCSWLYCKFRDRIRANEDSLFHDTSEASNPNGYGSVQGAESISNLDPEPVELDHVGCDNFNDISLVDAEENDQGECADQGRCQNGKKREQEISGLDDLVYED
eukprot:CAMPEP_0114496444 /NCGR_PEP_ID=MMETSP0109-20121206/5773_1 /TAXON_ID=29199 /ORGANISM="Chlorarachnion reptans, Strain CCCM449" /LENGTH=870 /DNA_ID=CAMNT_0001673717 /DNA_START=495 /DNA_END=3106 /DNA_ORIENTATION=+